MQYTSVKMMLSFAINHKSLVMIGRLLHGCGRFLAKGTVVVHAYISKQVLELHLYTELLFRSCRAPFAVK